MPRVVPNDAVSTAPASTLNTRFDRIDAETRAMRRECRAAQARMSSDHEPGDFETSVDVTMRGPRFLSLTITGSSDCGGAHPDGYTLGLVLDTATGTPIDWLPLLPGSKPGYKSETAAGSDWLLWPPFLEAARAQAAADTGADADCKPVFADNKLQFTAWLDADKNAIVGYPAGLSHIDDALCGAPVVIDLPRARHLGVSPILLDALQTAHTAIQQPSERPAQVQLPPGR